MIKSRYDTHYTRMYRLEIAVPRRFGTTFKCHAIIKKQHVFVLYRYTVVTRRIRSRSERGEKNDICYELFISFFFFFTFTRVLRYSYSFARDWRVFKPAKSESAISEINNTRVRPPCELRTTTTTTTTHVFTR